MNFVAMPRRTPLLPLLAPVLLSAFAPAQAAWTRLYPTQVPTPCSRFGVATDEAHGETILLFGFSTPLGAINDSWRWTGTDWQQIGAALPPLRHDHRLAWDSRRQLVVMFGGQTVNTQVYFQDIWEWDGTQWTANTPSASPPARAGHAMAYDRVRGTLVVHGGHNNAPLDDTWEFDGTAWHNATQATRPTLTGDAAMAFDPQNQNILLYGDNTYSWDGANWQFHTPATPPGIRVGLRMVTDLERNRVVLYGGNQADFTTWEWDGSQWHELFLASPGPRSDFALAYDPTHHQVVFHGGFDSGLQLYPSDTFVYATPNPASVTAYGSGCPGSIGTPALANAPYSLPWLGDTLTMQVGNLAPTAPVAMFATGFVPTAPRDLGIFGMPGCNGLLVPIPIDFELAAGGLASWSTVIPNLSVLTGAHLYQQVFVIEPGVNPTGVIVSNGSDMVVGVR